MILIVWFFFLLAGAFVAISPRETSITPDTGKFVLLNCLVFALSGTILAWNYLLP